MNFDRGDLYAFEQGGLPTENVGENQGSDDGGV